MLDQATRGRAVVWLLLPVRLDADLDDPLVKGITVLLRGGLGALERQKLANQLVCVLHTGCLEQLLGLGANTGD